MILINGISVCLRVCVRESVGALSHAENNDSCFVFLISSIPSVNEESPIERTVEKCVSPGKDISFCFRNYEENHKDSVTSKPGC